MGSTEYTPAIVLIDLSVLVVIVDFLHETVVFCRYIDIFCNSNFTVEPAGYITVMQFGYEFDRSPVILPQNIKLLETLEHLNHETKK